MRLVRITTQKWRLGWLSLLLFALGMPAAGMVPPEEVAQPGASAQALPFRDGSLISKGGAFRVLAVTAGGVALVWIGALGLRRVVLGRHERAATQRHIRILETCRLSPRSALVLLRVRDKEVLLGQWSEGLVVLHVDDSNDDALQQS